MATKQRKLILYISCSLDGYIAKSNDDLGFLSLVQKEGEDYGYHDFVETVDTVIMGRKTYDWLIGQGFEFPHKDKESYIITRQERPKQGNINFYNSSLKTLLSELKAGKGKNIYCDGGAEIVNQLLKDMLFDELIISVIPVLLGNGIRLFSGDIPEQTLTLLSVKSFDTGLIQLHYAIKES